MDLLKKLTECNSVSGNEKNISNFIKEYVSSYADEIREDALGNLIVRKKGAGKKIMLAAHMDEIGIIVTFIDEDGFIRFSSVGGLYTKELLGRRVQFENGTVGVISMDGDEKEPKIQKMFVDIGASNREEAQKCVKIGDTACFMGELIKLSENRVMSKAMDNRIGCYILLKALEASDNPKNDMYFVFTTQEEVGLRGAKTAAYGVDPEIAVSVDVTDTGDIPKCPHMAVRLGMGAAIKVMDRSCMCNPYVRELLINISKENNIPYQLEVLTAGGTDAGAINISRGGVLTGGLSVPTRYIHSPSEVIDMADAQACTDIIVKLCNY